MAPKPLLFMALLLHSSVRVTDLPASAVTSQLILLRAGCRLQPIGFDFADVALHGSPASKLGGAP
jgi:hypothetical protein